MTPDEIMDRIDKYAFGPQAHPYYGWHDDHRAFQRTGGYRPALQQVRSEFAELVKVICDHELDGGIAILLGLGWGGACHVALRQMFDFVVTVENNPTVIQDFRQRYRLDSRHDAILEADTHTAAPMVSAVLRDVGIVDADFLFIDAGHKRPDVELDYQDYAPMVKPGGVIAFHDSLKRPGYETEIDVWRVMDDMRAGGHKLHTIGSEVGIDWMVKA